MLETKDLVKIYKPKKGVPVKALDKVSLKFPDKGMAVSYTHLTLPTKA